MTDSTDVFLKVVERLSKVAAKKRMSPITGETELYRNLGLYGDDLFEFAQWTEKEFGIEPRLNLASYAPKEWPLFRLWSGLRKLMGRGEPQFKSLKVRDVVAAIEAKRWPDSN
ncbi:MAG: hypothetical protein V4517_16275 [Pseudomonadota bacterium]